jgi:hypothetical protein
VRQLACRRRACYRPWRPLRAAPRHQRRPQLERLDGREGGDAWRRPNDEEKGQGMSGYVTKLKARREECYSLQAGEALLAFS